MAHIIEMPKLSDTMEEGVIASWTKKEGEFVEEGETIAEIETDKATMDYGCPEEGILVKILVPSGKTCELNEPIAVLAEKGENIDVEAVVAEWKSANSSSDLEKAISSDQVKDAENAAPEKQSAPSQGNGNRLRSSPLARKIAQEKGIELDRVTGSGPNGRIILRDVEAYKVTSEPISSSIEASQDFSRPLTMMRKTIAKRLLQAKNEAPHFYLTRSFDMTQILRWRTDLNHSGETRISVNDLIVLAVSKALRKHPAVNSSWAEDKIIEFGDVHMAIAVALPEGLVTPVLRHSDHLGVDEIAQKSRELIAVAKSGKMTPDQYQGGTFTISNLGMMGIEEFTAIINPPQAAILAVGATNEIPCVVDGNIVIRPKMKVTMSCDHRVIDGAMGAQFLATLASFIENPVMMLR